MPIRLLILSVALLFPFSLHAEEKTYEIKLKEEATGDKTKVTESMKESTEFKMAVGDQNLNREQKKEIKKGYVEELLKHEKGAKRSEKLKRDYTTARETTDGKEKTHTYEGKKVLIEKKSDKYVFKADDEELAESECKELHDEFNKKDEIPLANRDFLPEKKVALNEVWNVDAGKVVESFESSGPFKLDKDGSKVEGKLTKVYDKNKQSRGIIELTIKLKVKAIKADGQEIPMKESSTIKIAITLDVCIDGTSHDGEENSTVNFDLTGDLPNGDLTLTGEIKSDKKVEEVKAEK